MSKRTNQIKAVEALMDFAFAMVDGDLSIGDLVSVMRAAIEDGHETLIIYLGMASNALTLTDDMGVVVPDFKQESE